MKKLDKYAHLTTGEDETLLRRWHTRLFFDLLLYACDLRDSGNKGVCMLGT